MTYQKKKGRKPHPDSRREKHAQNSLDTPRQWHRMGGMGWSGLRLGCRWDEGVGVAWRGHQMVIELQLKAIINVN